MITTHFCPDCGVTLVEREIDQDLRSVCSRCGKILYRHPVPVAGCAAERDSGPCTEVLLARRKFEPWKDQWYFASGFVEYGDDGEATARRRIQEETGLIVDLGQIFGIYSYFDDPRQHGIIILNRATIMRGTLQAGDDSIEAAFFAADAPPAIEQVGFATHRRALAEWRDEVVHGVLAPRAERDRARYLASRPDRQQSSAG